MGREFPSQPVVGVGAVVLRAGVRDGDVEVLLVKRANAPSQGEWSLPGGMVEVGERLEAAVAREVFEETGLEVALFRQIEVLDHIVREGDGRVRFHYVLVDFACSVTGGQLASSSDALDARWASLASIDAFALQAPARAVIAKAARSFLSHS